VLHLQDTRPTSGKQWTDNGATHEERGLKQREKGAVRSVPVPPSPVRILKSHIEEFGVADDGRLFANERGGLLGPTTVHRVFNEARDLALGPPLDLHRRDHELGQRHGAPPAARCQLCPGTGVNYVVESHTTWGTLQLPA